jgi:hypothetical protein
MISFFGCTLGLASPLQDENLIRLQVSPYGNSSR